MRLRKWIGTLSLAVCGSVSLSPIAFAAATDSSSLASMKLDSAGDVVQVCTVAPTDQNYDAALGFCYGFFEGAIRYHQAMAGSDIKRHLVCAPAGTTRLQGVEVFVNFMQEHPEYASEGSIDAVFRALMARWPCN